MRARSYVLQRNLKRVDRSVTLEGLNVWRVYMDGISRLLIDSKVSSAAATSALRGFYLVICRLIYQIIHRCQAKFMTLLTYGYLGQ
jgi:hypothetical protein